MSIELQGSLPVTVNAYRANDNDPTKGYWLAIDGEHVHLTPEQADRLGRYLLFDDAPTKG